MPPRALAFVLLLLATALAPSVRAQTVSIYCPRLDREARDELRARMRLALRSVPGGSAPFRVAVRCTDRDAALIWEGAFREQVSIDESSGVVEGALDALEERIANGPQTRRRSEPPLWVVPPPSPSPARPRPPRHGGVGLGAAFELGRTPISVGPRLDLGIPVGPVSLVGVQSLRGAARKTLLFTAEGGVGFGAPYRNDYHFGIVASAGVDALSSVGSEGGPESPGWAHAPVVSLGARGAWTVDRSTLWLGVDGRRRLEPLAITEPDVELARTTLLVSVGVLFGIDLTERRMYVR